MKKGSDRDGDVGTTKSGTSTTDVTAEIATLKKVRCPSCHALPEIIRTRNVNTGFVRVRLWCPVDKWWFSP